MPQLQLGRVHVQHNVDLPQAASACFCKTNSQPHTKTAAELLLPCDEESLLALNFTRASCPSHLFRLLHQYNLIRVPREARLVLLYRPSHQMPFVLRKGWGFEVNVSDILGHRGLENKGSVILRLSHMIILVDPSSCWLDCLKACCYSVPCRALFSRLKLFSHPLPSASSRCVLAYGSSVISVGYAQRLKHDQAS